ncbi:MAG TPA: alpha/beta hydrolase [Streptosporangiaceae bacterium]|nr:alpha/beta hydrolase [Streptosporangiaceae bacterium]
MQLSELNAHRHTAATRFGEISYLDLGAGPTALFVHGIATNAYLWRHVMDALSGQRRCIAIDLPLHGQSPVTAEQDLSLAALAAGLDDFCEVLGLTGIDLVANDTGGAIAQIFAARHPQRLATLTLTNCDTVDNLPPEAFKPMVELAAAGNLAPSAVAMFANVEAAAQISFASGYEHVDLIDRDVIRSYLQPCFGTIERARQFERLLVSLRVGDLQAVMPQLGELTVPTLVVWGTGDAFFDVSWAYWLRDTIPGTTRVITVDGARLFFPEERPMDLVPHLEQHWAAVAAARA